MKKKALHKSIGNPFWQHSRFKRVHKNKKKYDRNGFKRNKIRDYTSGEESG